MKNGAAAAADASASAAGTPVERSPHGDQRDFLPDPDWVPVAGPATAVRNWSTVYGRHRRWPLDGTWAQILDVLRAGCDAAEGMDWTVRADSTVVRAHQHAAGPAPHRWGAWAGGPGRMTRTRGLPGRAGGAGPFPRRADHQDSLGRRPAVPPGHQDPPPASTATPRSSSRCWGRSGSPGGPAGGPPQAGWASPRWDDVRP
jgi:transposase